MKVDSYQQYFVRDSVAKKGYLFIEPQVMEHLAANLPRGYHLPNIETLEIFEDMSADAYNYLFEEKAGLNKAFVDRALLDEVVKALPDNYTLPDATIISSLIVE